MKSPFKAQCSQLYSYGSRKIFVNNVIDEIHHQALRARER